MSNQPSLPHPSAEKEQKQVNRIYAALAAMIIFSCLPLAVLQVVAILLLFYVMGSAYILRSKYGEDSLVHNHMTYLIRTFWISSLFFAIGFVAAGFYLSGKLDLAAIEEMSNTMLTGQFVVTENMKLLAVVSLVSMGPSMIYFIYRVAKGLSRALRGHRMGNVKEWF